ncbi:MAG: hypothetical protein WCD35_17455 [Mycobacteriales bacterium]
MTLTAARAVADAVLYEGYLLYPYRASSPKNQVRWQFGILGPPGAQASGAGEQPAMQAECLVELAATQELQLDVHLRFLQVLERTVEVDGVPVPELRVGHTCWIPWQEATEQELQVLGTSLRALAEGVTVPVDVPGGVEHEQVHHDGTVVGRLVRTRQPLSGLLSLSSRPAADRQAVLHVRVENLTPWDGTARRDTTARASFVGTHLLLTVRGGRPLSLTETPGHGCVNERCWPVLVADDDGQDAVLVSPIILPDHPAIAPESAGDLFDATEIDEILTLRVMTLTDEEKVAARGTDARAAAIIDRCDGLPPEVMARLHGALRDLPGGAPQDVPWWDPGQDASVSPETDSVLVDGVPVARGSRVRLRPRAGGDAQDMFLTGLTATVTSVLSDVDGGTHVAVTVDDDPASDLHEWYGRFSYFRPDEIEPLP